MSEWINVKDRLPEVVPEGGSDYVLVALRGYIGPHIGYLDPFVGWRILIFTEMSARWQAESLFPRKGKVTHWMPLPELPGEATNDD